MKPDYEQVSSVLILHDVTIRQASFERYSGKDWQDYEPDFEIRIQEDEDSRDFEVLVSISIFSEECFKLDVSCGGVFGFSADEELTDEQVTQLHSNAVAILFPYLRTYITQLTAIPNMKPLVLPVINVNRLIDYCKTCSDES